MHAPPLQTFFSVFPLPTIIPVGHDPHCWVAGKPASRDLSEFLASFCPLPVQGVGRGWHERGGLVREAGEPGEAAG